MPTATIPISAAYAQDVDQVELGEEGVSREREEPEHHQGDQGDRNVLIARQPQPQGRRGGGRLIPRKVVDNLIARLECRQSLIAAHRAAPLTASRRRRSS